MKTPTTAALLLALAVPGSAQGEGAPTKSFEDAAASIRTELQASIEELERLREDLAAEKIPLDRELGKLEGRLADVRVEYQEVTRLLDSRTLDLSTLRTNLQARRDQATYLSDLLTDYSRNFEARLHIAELQRYADVLDAAKLAADADRGDPEAYRAGIALLDASLDRLDDALGGTRFEGTAVDRTGIVHEGTFVLVGPTAIFRSEDGQHVGTAEQRLGSLEPTILSFGSPEDAGAAADLVLAGEGFFPLDPSLGDAHKIESTNETFLEHVQKGGAVMVPIFLLAGAALLVAFCKWVGMLFVRKPARKKVAALLEAVERHDRDAAEERVRAIRGPAGRMLAAGVRIIDEPRELIEEVMYETVLTTRLRLQRFLSFIAICAASAPLLGLLGTVTGIIDTFKLITIFGSGDVKTLSGGISEALITTKFGLIVAIPSLLIHSFLSRKARGIVAGMETVAVKFANQVSRSWTLRPRPRVAGGEGGEGGTGAPDPELVREQVGAILNDLLGPLAADERDGAVAAAGEARR